MLDKGLTFIMLMCTLFIVVFLQGFYNERELNKRPFLHYWDDHVISDLEIINGIYYIYWFVYIYWEP